MAVRSAARPSPGLQRRLRRLWRVRLAGITIIANPRLRTTLARYRPATARLEVSRAAARSRDLQCILVHELAHAAAVELYGRKVKPHGEEWKALIQTAQRAGFKTATPRPPCASR